MTSIAISCFRPHFGAEKEEKRDKQKQHIVETVYFSFRLDSN
jgi:hypothetical protein